MNRLRLPIVLLASALALAACGSDDDSGVADAATGTTTAAESVSDTAPSTTESVASTTSPVATEAPATEPPATPAPTTVTADVEPWTLRVGFIGTRPEWGGPEGFANQQGTLLEALAPLGVTEIEAFQFGNGPDLNQALSGGSLDVGLYGDTPAINFRASGQPTRLIAQNRINLNAILYTPTGGATTLKDLVGSTIGVPQGSYMHRFVLGLLAEEGLSDSIEVTNLLIPDAVAALQGGDVGAFAAPWSQAPILDAQGFPRLLETFPDYPHLAGSSVTVVTDSLLEAHPGFVEVWNAARADALAAAQADPEAYYDFQQPILNVDRQFVPQLEEELANYPVEPFTDEGLALLEGTKQFLVEIGAAQSDFEISDWQYIPGA